MERHERIGKVIGNKGRLKIIIETEDGEIYELPRMSAKRIMGKDVVFDMHDAREAEKLKVKKLYAQCAGSIVH